MKKLITIIKDFDCQSIQRYWQATRASLSGVSMVVKGDYVRRRLDLLGFFFVNYRIQMPMDVAHSIMSIPCIFTALKKENPILLYSPESTIRQDE